MFNPEKLLGDLISSGLKGQTNSLLSGGAALGLLGVAMEAFSHYTNSSQASPPTRPPVPGVPPPPPGSGMGAAPPPPPSASGVPLPPVPAGVSTSGPPASPFPAGSLPSGIASPPRSEAVLLIRAMIAAANADGVIDDDEKAGILKRLHGASLTAEEYQFIIRELSNPLTSSDIADQVTSPETARKVYTVSLMAVEVNTEAEKVYLRTLRSRLGLDEATLSDIHDTLGVALF